MLSGNILERLRKFITKLKWLWELQQVYVDDMAHARRARMDLDVRVTSLSKEFSSQMAIGFDIHPMSNSWVICIGHHKNHDYVRVFPVEDEDFSYLVDLVIRMNHEYPKARFYFDHPYGVGVSEIYKDYKNRGK